MQEADLDRDQKDRTRDADRRADRGETERDQSAEQGVVKHFRRAVGGTRPVRGLEGARPPDESGGLVVFRERGPERIACASRLRIRS
jgi:hypothetical protein